MAEGCQIIASDEGAAQEVINSDGRAPIALVCEHASKRIPRSLANLGLDAPLLDSHIAWDPGALEVARGLSENLDAPLVAVRFSRLVYDCNRPPEAGDAILETSEFGPVPGNIGLAAEDRTERARCLYYPFHETVDEVLRKVERTAGRPPVLITVHSFTAVYRGNHREVEIGVLHDTDARLADAMLAGARRHTDLLVRRNDPYGPQDGVTHTLVRHAVPRGLLNVMIEIRNDLLPGAQECRAVAKMLTGWLNEALEQVEIQGAERR